MKMYILSSTHSQKGIQAPILFDSRDQAFAEMKRQCDSIRFKVSDMPDAGIIYADGRASCYTEKRDNIIWRIHEIELPDAPTASVKCFVLNCTSEREIEEPKFFDSQETAYEAMENDFLEMLDADSLDEVELDKGGDFITENSAYCTVQGINVDWNIHEVEIPVPAANIPVPDSGLATHHIFGKYVLTPVPNAFNHQTSWWLSRKNCTVARYCFSTCGSIEQQKAEAARHMEVIETYIKLFETRQDST